MDAIENLGERTRYLETLERSGSIFMADDQWIGIGAALERIVFDAAGDICVMGAKVGIGTLIPNGILEVWGDNSINGDLKWMVNIANDTDAYNASPAAGIQFTAKYTGAGAYADLCGIMGGKENVVDGNTASFLSLHTRAAGGNIVEAMRVTSTGQLAIGQATAKGPLDVHTDYVGFNINQVTLADDASIALTGLLTGNNGILEIVDRNSAAAAGSVYIRGGVNSVSIIDDALSNFSTADTDGKLCIIAAGGSAYTLKNRLGFNSIFILRFFGAY